MSIKRPSSNWTIDTTKASVARVYDAGLGGKDNYEVDRQMLQKLLAKSPDALETPRMVKAFGKRIVRYTAEQGIQQFLDLGSGIPTTPPAVHETARSVHADARVAYVDNDPVVVAHSRALRNVGPGLVSILADLTDPETVLNDEEVIRALDVNAPMTVLLVSVMQNTLDDNDARRIIGHYAERIAPGSFLGLAHLSTRSTEAAMEGVRRSASQAGYPETVFRDDDSIRSLFAGFELVDPGLVDIKDWQPDEPDTPAVSLTLVGGLGRKTG
jgi:hypothetical protein